jgi:cellulose synthase/poly-beta-1,6-N-acetylglucosamine synthase-like glycosyltransferase
MTTLQATMTLMLAIAALPLLVGCGYLAVLAVASCLPARRERPRAGGTWTFDVIVPAHDEASGIAATVASLQSLAYPPAQFRVVVVADNCTDDTAGIARRAGAHVLERHDLTRRGKGHALAHAFAWSAADGFANAVVVVDADTVVAPSLLSAFAEPLDAGECCVQGDYGVRNAADSWRTRLMAVAFAMYHALRSLGRERLGVSCGLRGNGMAFTHDLLRRVPYAAFSVVEDVEYGVMLGLAGVRIAYAHDARVLGDMPTTGSASRSQRERWEGGRTALARRFVPPLVRDALRTRRALPLDLALDLLIPPLTRLVAFVLAGGAVSLALVLAGIATWPAFVLWLLPLAALALYVVRGAVLSGSGSRVVLDLLWAPVYAGWKLTGARRPSAVAKGEWVRTERRTAD